MTSRQKSLYLIAKLYELAAEFTDAELREIAKNQSQQAQSIDIQNAIEALIQLHAAAENGETPSFGREASSRDTMPTAEASSLAELLDDRTAFPTVGDIAAILAIDARPKEARGRYIARVSRIVGSMASRDRAMFLKRVAEKVNKRPDSFISNWSKLIKEM